MTRAAAYAIAFGVAVFAGWLVPALAMRALAPSLESSRLSTTNYRGRSVFLGLGLVWVVWSVALLVASTALDAAGSFSQWAYGSVEMLLFDGPLTLLLYTVPIMLTVCAVVFGLVDDVFGSHADKGFRGHLSALASGRLTTGGLKLLGIGLVAAVYGWHAAAGQAKIAGTSSAAVVGLWWVIATLVIALSANFMNLMDLRPGRALKTYGVLASAAGIVFVLNAVAGFRAYAGEAGTAWSDVDTLWAAAAALVVLLGPVVAIWRMDLGERGMLGDAGSNAMGAIVGYLLAGALPLPWLAAIAALLLALNALSERVSFGAIIDRTPPLRYLDRVGRLAEDEVGTTGESDGGT